MTIQRFLLMAFILQGCHPNYLENCWKKQVAPLQTEGLSFAFERTSQGFFHGMEPWEKYTLKYKGQVWLDGQRFGKRDTIFLSESNKVSLLKLSPDTLLLKNYRDTTIQNGSRTEWKRRFIRTLRYSPVALIDSFFKEDIPENHDPEEDFAVYTMTKKELRISLFIDKKECLVKKVTVLGNDRQDDAFYGLGDVLDTYRYSDFGQLGPLLHPKKITIDKLNGKLFDSVHLKSLEKRPFKEILESPENYELGPEEVVEIDLGIEQFSNRIYFINMYHLGTRSLLVEFADHVLVAGAPLNSKNGSLLLGEVKKIVGDKPIKYFVYGHFHPHCTGGIRPFIHAGARIIRMREDQAYVQHLATTAHTLDPDALEKEPKPVLFDFIDGEKVLSEGDFEMKIIHIGEKSNHTKDYLIYYFPREKMIFEDDLVWIDENSTPENISELTKGFYNAVKELDIEVETVVQNWGVFDREKPMIFSFRDIEAVLGQ